MKCRNKITAKVKENLHQTKTAALMPKVRHNIMVVASFFQTRALFNISNNTGGLIIPLYLKTINFKLKTKTKWQKQY